MTEKLQRKLRAQCATEAGTCLCPFYKIYKREPFCTATALPITSDSVSHMIVKISLLHASENTIRDICPLRKSDITIVLKED